MKLMPPRAVVAALVLAVALVVALGGCAGAPVQPFRHPEPEHAAAPQADTAFAAIEKSIRDAHGADASGFHLLDRNEDGLRWRLALIDSARHTIAVQYYIWFDDTAANLLTSHLLAAADRGVKIRMLLDDLNTLLGTAGSVKLRDLQLSVLNAHPNIELRLFNPWKDRSLAGRLGESAANMQRLNARMHNKALIADNQATIIGGRNIGDEYMGLHADFNFRDLDVIGFGPVARQTSAVFDLYWNSDWVLPVSALRLQPTATDLHAAQAQLSAKLLALPPIEGCPVAPQSWSDELTQLAPTLLFGTSRVISDVPTAYELRQDMVGELYALALSAQRELLVENAYIIPDDKTLKAIQELRARGVTVKILTNSLASHDVPAVNSHYKKWRKPLLEAGVELHEARSDAAIQALVADTPPTHGGFMGLHAKAMVVDRERAFIGSMNFDPRSANINTEMGVIIDSADFSQALANLLERDMAPENAWLVRLDARNELRWTDDRETVTRQPARNWWQRVQDVFFMAFPKDLY